MGNAIIQAEAIVKTPFLSFLRRDCVVIPYSSFRASGARHGIQSRLGGIQYVLDAGWSLSAFGWPA
ncbi:MAG TPA: hypothetical protein PK874_04680 [Desulfobacteraceae bacterium]|nr:hypothetical protein [Desulfobacteraceae bacterium]HPJ67629.1 hypothetical protein [Desulfobacteraceae bacterium]